MNNEYFAEMHKLIEKAKTYERIGREEEALKIYLEIHERFFPNTSDLFERPAILLEKRKRFDEAISMCEKAVKLIQEGKITGIKENFDRRIARIKARSDYTGPKVTPKQAHSFHWPKLKWRRSKKEDVPKREVPIRERSLRERPGRETPVKETLVVDKPVQAKELPVREPAAKDVIEREAVDKVLNDTLIEDNFADNDLPISEVTEAEKTDAPLTALDHPKVEKERFKRIKAYLRGLKDEANKFRKPTKTELIAMAIFVVFIGGGIYMINNKPQSKFEVMIDVSKIKDGKALEGSPFEKNLEDLPPISKTMIDTAVKETQTLIGVKQAGIIVQKDVVGFVIMTNPGTSKAQAKSASEAFVKSLARAAAVENPELKGPGAVGYGELFDYYTLLVVAGENYDNLILKGSKNAKALGIYWRDDSK